MDRGFLLLEKNATSFFLSADVLSSHLNNGFHWQKNEVTSPQSQGARSHSSVLHAATATAASGSCGGEWETK